jgi:trigger factor
LVPNFTLDLEAKNDIVKYVVTADDKLIDGQVASIQNNLELQFHKKLLLQIQMLLELSRRKGINNATTIAADLLKTKRL